jgi:Fe-S-cluster containining protein
MADLFRLQALYNRLPKLSCQGLCWESCGVIPLHKDELVQIRRHVEVRPRDVGHPGAMGDGLRQYKTDYVVLRKKGKLTCPLLDGQRRCRAYDWRPLICRLFGLVEKMRCPHGCTPERFLSENEAYDLVEEMAEILEPKP